MIEPVFGVKSKKFVLEVAAAVKVSAFEVTLEMAKVCVAAEVPAGVRNTSPAGVTPGAAAVPMAVPYGSSPARVWLLSVLAPEIEMRQSPAGTVVVRGAAQVVRNRSPVPLSELEDAHRRRPPMHQSLPRRPAPPPPLTPPGDPGRA